jgi:uncharacterized Zn-finger protein
MSLKYGENSWKQQQEKRMPNKNITIVKESNNVIYCPTIKNHNANSHPKVFLKFNTKTKIAICPYCSHAFKKED